MSILNDYINLSYWFACHPENYDDVPDEGWKIHIAINNGNDLVRGECLLEDLLKLKIPNKIVPPDKVEDFNRGDKQDFKIITIYAENLTFLNQLSKESKDFISENVNYSIATDKRLFGRLNVRYTGFKNDMVLNPNTGKHEYVPREEGFYKPSWISDLNIESFNDIA